MQEESKDDDQDEKETKKEDNHPKKWAKKQVPTCLFPSVAELNARFRRLMTLYQRTSKMSVARREQIAKVGATANVFTADVQFD